MADAQEEEKLSTEDRGLLELARDLDIPSMGFGIVLGALATSFTTFIMVIRPMKKKLDLYDKRASELATIASHLHTLGPQSMHPSAHVPSIPPSNGPYAVGRAPSSYAPSVPSLTMSTIRNS